MIKNGTIGMLVIALGVLLVPIYIFATSPIPSTYNCLPFTSNLTIGSRNTDVSNLQNYLISKGFLIMPVGVSVGYFGNITRAGLAAFQASVGISPAVGYFGPITMKYVNSHCGLPPITNAVSIFSISPSSGPIGTRVTITGSGFSSTANGNVNTVNFGSHTLPNQGTNNTTTFAFSVPADYAAGCFPAICDLGPPTVVPDIYPVSVTSINGTSNTVNFTVTSEAYNYGCSGVDAQGRVTSCSPYISSINPTSGPSGTLITITGSGFDSNSRVLLNNRDIKGSFINYSTMTVTMPANYSCVFNNPCSLEAFAAPQTFSITVQNNFGISNTVNFTLI